MANIPEHIHAFPRVNPNLVLPEAVGAWDSENKILYIGDGKTKGGIPFENGSSCLRISSCYNNVIVIPSLKYIPFMLKTNNGNFYSIRGEDLSIYDNSFQIDISNALAVNNLSEFVSDWYIYFGGKTEY